ncbi:MAG TPA: hypothetical protein VHZ76_00895 [Gammaproteobacteria bacterium]|jgi:hypothetical protein|nr:hypothetical protein [Gammaproteobacteria bacterium]
MITEIYVIYDKRQKRDLKGCYQTYQLARLALNKTIINRIVKETLIPAHAAIHNFIIKEYKVIP